MKKKQKILQRAARGVVTTVLIASASTTFGQTVPKTQNYNQSSSLSLKYTPGSGPSLDTLAATFGFSKEDFQEELRAGKTPKQILSEQGFTASQIKKIFKRA